MSERDSAEGREGERRSCILSLLPGAENTQEWEGEREGRKEVNEGERMQKQETRRWEEWEKTQRRETTKTGKPDLRSVWENGREEVGRKGK